MVSPDTRNNLIVLTLIVAICIIVGSFIVAFSNNLERTSREGMQTVQVAADNVTSATKDMVGLLDKQAAIFNDGFANLTMVLNKQYNLTVEDKEQQARNLGIFMDAFTNQTNTMVAAINEQKDVFVDTLEKSQNQTKETQQTSLGIKNVTEQRNALLQEQIKQFDVIIAQLRNNSDMVKNSSQNITDGLNGTLKLQPTTNQTTG